MEQVITVMMGDALIELKRSKDAAKIPLGVFCWHHVDSVTWLCCINKFGSVMWQCHEKGMSQFVELDSKFYPITSEVGFP